LDAPAHAHLLPPPTAQVGTGGHPGAGVIQRREVIQPGGGHPGAFLGEEAPYLHPKVILLFGSEMLMFGLGQTRGMTCFAIPMTGLIESFFSSGVSKSIVYE
jgi:hypothetical protein